MVVLELCHNSARYCYNHKFSFMKAMLNKLSLLHLFIRYLSYYLFPCVMPKVGWRPLLFFDFVLAVGNRVQDYWQCS